MRIYLVGYMGSGKSTLGKNLAKALGVSFIDLDKTVEAQAGMTIAKLFQQKGESHFRALEAAALRQTEQQNCTVVATGGGTPLYYGGMDWMLSRGTVVYLQATPAFLFSRLGQGHHPTRPLLRGLSVEQLTEHLTSRASTYEQAHILWPVPKGSVTQLTALLRTILPLCNTATANDKGHPE